MWSLSFGRYHTTKVEAGTTSLGAFALLLPSRLSSLATSALALARPPPAEHACHSTHRSACLRPAVWCFALGFGGLAQLLAGMWEARRGKMFR